MEKKTTRARASDPLVDEWIRSIELQVGGTVPDDVVGTMNRMVRKSRNNGFPDDVIATAIQKLVESGKPPLDLPSSLFNAKHRQVAGRDMLAEFLNQHGGRWPTGSRWVRGTHGGQFIEDPLGFDKPDYHTPWGHPNRSQVLEALRKRSAASEGGNDPGGA